LCAAALWQRRDSLPYYLPACLIAHVTLYDFYSTILPETPAMTLAPERTSFPIDSIDAVSEGFLERLDARIAARHVLQHPFYQAWNAGTLSREALQDYAAQYYHHVAAFPAYLSAVHSSTPDLAARRSILQNLIDEEAGTPNHPELWLQFAAGVGVAPDAVKDTPVQPETAALIRTFDSICRNGRFTDGIAALYAYESQIPEVAQSKIDGLKRNYAHDYSIDEAMIRYFAVHIDADAVHRADERALLAQHITSEKDADTALDAADRALEAVWNLLSGVCIRHNIACH